MTPPFYYAFFFAHALTSPTPVVIRKEDPKIGENFWVDERCFYIQHMPGHVLYTESFTGQTMFPWHSVIRVEKKTESEITKFGTLLPWKLS